MALAWLQALEAYLGQCRTLSNFAEIARQQCLQVVKEVDAMEKLDLAEGGPLLACIQQNKFWSSDEKEMISQAVHSKVKEHLVGKAVNSRLPMQQFQNFPMYLMDSEWTAVLSESSNVQQKCDVVMTRLHAIGLTAPSEDTLAMLTVVLLLRDSQRLSDGVQLRSSYLAVKQMVKGFLKSVKERRDEHFDFIEKLPADPAAISPIKLRNMYPNDSGPSKLPNGVDMENLLRLMSLVPQRSTSRSISMQLPKAAGHSFMDSNLMAAQQMAAQMFMASMGNMAAFHPVNAQLGFQASGNSSSSGFRPGLPALTGPSTAPLTAPAQVEVSKVEVVPVVKAPSPTKAPLAIRDVEDPPAEQAADKTKIDASPANITAVNERLEEALRARDQSKKDKKEEVEEQKGDSSKKAPAPHQVQKKPGMKNLLLVWL